MRSQHFLSLPLGVDLVELEKARAFYQRHKSHLESFFSLREVSYIQKGPRPHERLAVLWGAKEALMKALAPSGAMWGILGKIRVLPRRDGSIRFRIPAAWPGTRMSHGALSCSVLRGKRYLVVRADAVR